jgi:hypothetical protein
MGVSATAYSPQYGLNFNTFRVNQMRIKLGPGFWEYTWSSDLRWGWSNPQNRIGSSMAESYRNRTNMWGINLYPHDDYLKKITTPLG